KKLSNAVVAKAREEPEFSIEAEQKVAGEEHFTKNVLEAEEGRTIDYQIVVKNTGNVAIEFAALVDGNCTGISPAGATEVAVGKSETLTCEHTITSAGSWSNEAQIEGVGKKKPSNGVVVKTPE